MNSAVYCEIMLKNIGYFRSLNHKKSILLENDLKDNNEIRGILQRKLFDTKITIL